MATSPDPPREPSAYSPSVHFGERFRDRYDEHNRHLDGEIVAGCIKHGNAAESGSGTVRFYEWFGGVEYCIVVNVRRGVVVSGYPVNIDEDDALASGRWSKSQLQDIRSSIAANDTD